MIDHVNENKDTGTTEAGTTASAHRDIATAVIGGYVSAGSPAVSPDGTQIAFVVRRVAMADNAYRSQVWLAPADGSRPPRPITGGEHDGQPVWSPDAFDLAFTSQRSEKKEDTTLHVLPIGVAGELRTVATMPDGVDTPRWSPDGRWIAFISRTRDQRYEEKDESWQSPRKIERFFTKLNGEGWVFDRPSHVYVVPSDATAPPRNLTPGPWQHEGISWLADSSGIVTSSQRHDTWDLDLASDLYMIPRHGEVRALTHQTGIYGEPAVSPDGIRVAFIGYDDPLTDPQNAKVGVIDVAGGEHRWVSSALDRTFAPTSGAFSPVWGSSGTLLASAEDRGRCHVYGIVLDDSADGDGAVAPPVAVTEGDRWVQGWHFAGGTLAATIAEVDSPAELHVSSSGGELRRLTHLSDTYVADVEPQPWERFTVPSADGEVEVDAWIMRPKDFEASRTYPVLFNVHGGPHTQYGETYFDEAQMQSAAGFVVLMCNPRGSSGREESWGQAILGPKHPSHPGTGWGGADVDDVLSVVDAALERYSFCDRERVGMLGGSYGGYMATTLAARHAERFKAFCSERAVNNMLSEEWSSDIGSVFRVEHGPSHVEDPDEYVRMSPITYAKDIHAPMLIIHSENDLRCPINQAEELFMLLRILRRDVTFYRFPAETHELSRSGSPVHRRQRAEIILDFFAEKLKA